MKNSVKTETCKKCRLCIEICPCKILAAGDNGEIYFLKEREHICVQCGQCIAVCSTGSVMVEGLPESMFHDLPEKISGYDEFRDFLSFRRSVRNFKDQPVSVEDMQKIIDTLAYAPYGSAPNEVHITAVTDRAVIESALPLMSAFLDNIVKWIESPMMRYMIKRRKGVETLNTLKNHVYPKAKIGNYKLENGDRITRGAPAILIFHADTEAEEHTHNAMIYGVYAMLAAQSLGLGATMISLVPAAINKIEEVKRIFGIPVSHEAIISVIIGHPKVKFKKAIRREKTNVNWITA
ncbi:MAG: nitroreductase family protein [Bacteroidota bacterium]